MGYRSALLLLVSLLFSFWSLSSWSACTLDGWADQYGIPEASTDASYYGECGMKITSDGTASYVTGAAFVEDQTPGSVTPPVTDYAARFYLNVDGVTLVQQPAELIVFRGWLADDSLAFEVGYSICDGQPLVYLKAGGTPRTDNIALKPGWNEITVWWSASGTMRLRVAGVGDQTRQFTSVSSSLDRVQLGIPTGTLRLFTGDIFMDEFNSTRGSDPGPKVNVCGQPLVVYQDMTFDSESVAQCAADSIKMERVKFIGGKHKFRADNISIGEISIKNGAQVSMARKF